MGLSIRAYAAHRSVSHTSVRKAIASGHVTLEPDGSIDLAKADRQHFGEIYEQLRNYLRSAGNAPGKEPCEDANPLRPPTLAGLRE